MENRRRRRRRRRRTEQIFRLGPSTGSPNKNYSGLKLTYFLLVSHAAVVWVVNASPRCVARRETERSPCSNSLNTVRPTGAAALRKLVHRPYQCGSQSPTFPTAGLGERGLMGTRSCPFPSLGRIITNE